MENPFFDCFKYWPKFFKKKFRIKVWTFSFQICFWNQFSTLEVVKRKIHKYAYLRIFSLTTSRSQKFIPKADLKWECPYFNSNFLSVSVNINFFLNGFFIVFSKSDLTWVGFYFWRKNIMKKPNTTKYA